MRKTIIISVTFITLTVLFLQYGYKPLTEKLGLRSKAGILVETTKSASVYVNGKQLGVTPFKDINLREGEYQLELKDASSEASWRSTIKLTGGTLTVVKRDLNQDQTKQAGEVVTIKKGEGAAITSIPGGAKVTVDGEDRGQTPLFLGNLTPEDHVFLLSKENFVKRTVRVNLDSGFGINIAVDLGQQEADSLPSSPPIATVPKVKVLATPTGFLRVRETASTGGKEIARVTPGDELTLIEETSKTWFKIKTADDKEGYVSAQYVEKQENDK